MPNAVIHVNYIYNLTDYIYLYNVIAEVRRFPWVTDIFIHSDEKFTISGATVVQHNLAGKHKHFLSWESREFIKKLIGYDIYMYCESTSPIRLEHVQHWIKYSDKLEYLHYNLGFITDKNASTVNLRHKTVLGKPPEEYILNTGNTNCGFWIYNNKVFRQWIKSPFFSPEHVQEDRIEDRCSAGLHANGLYWYFGTIIITN